MTAQDTLNTKIAERVEKQVFDRRLPGGRSMIKDYDQRYYGPIQSYEKRVKAEG